MSAEITIRRLSETWIVFEIPPGLPLGDASYDEDEEEWVFTQQAPCLFAKELEYIFHEMQKLNMTKEADHA